MEQPLLHRLPRWGMTRGGVLFERVTPEPPTSATGGSAWPTPQQRDFRHGSSPDSDRMQRKAAQGWTPNLNDVVNWPTPQAFDANTINRSPEALTRAKQKGGCSNLRESVTGQLNPDWVETLMGFPPGWTDPAISYTSRDLDSHNTTGSRPASPLDAITGQGV
jgi:hypothetical protein